MDNEAVLASTTSQTASPPHTVPSAPPSTTEKPWKPRRQGACKMCKLRKIRCNGDNPCLNCKRHDEECHYQRSRKRQFSKKPVESVWSLRSPEHRSQLEDTGNPTADGLVEPQNGWPVSVHSSTWRSGSLENGSCDKLRELDALPQNQTFGGALPENATWGPQRGVETVPSLPSVPPPTNMSNVPDPSGSFWPLFSMDNDWQIDFGDRSIIEPTNAVIGATPIALNELDLSQSYLQSNQGLESPGLPRGLVEYPITDGKESQSRGFLDPIPSIDYSLRAIFSLHDRELGHIGSSKREKVVRIFKSLSTVKDPPSSTDLARKQLHDGFASWYRNDETLMESCKAACFRRPVGISNFLTMPYLDSIIRETMGRSPEGLISVSLIDSVMAFGFQAYLTISQRSISSEERDRAHQYGKIPLRSRSSILCSPNTILKFQTILAMTTVAEQIDEIVYCELIASAISCARALKLDYRDFMHASNMSDEDKDLARRSLWYLYSIEVPQCLRHGVSPVLNHDWIDHAPPEAGTGTDWFSIQCLYAIVISSAAEMLYNQRALRQSHIEREQKLKTAFELLERWRKHLPTSLQEIHKQNTHLVLDDHQVRDFTLSIFRQYHEAVFMVYFPWAGNRSDGRVSEDCRKKSVEMCINSAQAVLAVTNQILNLDILDSKFLDLVSASICIIFLDVATRNTAEEGVSYLSMGCGILGRLTVLDNEVPFADVVELARMAQQIKGK